tara:strand:- start:507 stop:1634 length:1128 start_codon:yes stop_codon:yes gene_type:complete
MTKAAELAKMGEVLTNSQLGGRRNIVINGAMQVAQRGTSSGTGGVGASNGVYPTVDRFIFEAGNTAGRLTMTQETISDLSGFTKAIKLDCSTADTSIAADEFLMLGQRFEGQDLQQLKKGTSDAEKVTVSFYVKGNANATYTLELRDNDNSRSNSQEFSVTTSWNRVSMTFDGDTSGALDNDNALSLKCNIWLHGGSTYTGGTHTSNTWHGTTNQRVGDNQTSFFDSTDRTFFITGWQMEVGSQATPFEHRSFGEELALCQRYYHFSGFPKIIPGQDQSDGSLVDYEGQIFSWTLGGSNRHATSYSFPVKMRSNPAIVMYGPVDGTSARSAVYNSATQETVSAYYNESTNGLHGYFTCASDTTGQRFFLSADCDL